MNGPGHRAAQIEVSGTVQGVGFRPFVYRLAESLGLDGSVRNSDGRVLIDVAGTPDTVADFLRRLPAEAPPRSRIRDVVVTTTSADASTGSPVSTGFRVSASTGENGAARGGRDIPPDLATCDACVSELFDPADRRFRYPFCNCTDCGPRATLIADLPYDRQRTAMAAFPLCAACAAEYADPANRRFHAEPVACPACGPRLSWLAGAAVAGGEAALQAAEAAIRGGAVVAVKGLGGYQLVCDATDDAAVSRLRMRKHRPSKPFAVMVANLPAARRYAEVNEAEAALLTSAAAPIVLVPRRFGAGLAPAVHPELTEVGLFLPYTPLHHLLLADLARPLVVTSGNRAEEPICLDDDEALARLSDVADGFLQHDRAILARYDDSVTRVVSGRRQMLRRARGYAPTALPLPVAAPQPVLAVGAELKHTFTVASGTRAVVGPHGGDLEDADTMDAFRANLAHLSRVEGVTPAVVAHDLHPGYLSTQYARRLPVRRIGVQHHHAHLASCAAEHGVTERFVGIAYDGLGLGDDGALWGGEVLIADLSGYRRYARFSRAPLPGGAAAVRHPARTALGYLLGGEQLGGEQFGRAAGSRAVAEVVSVLGASTADPLQAMISRGINSPLASSAGRLFDAAASLLGLADGPVSYEGEAAIRLEHAADGATGAAMPWRLVRRDGLLVYDGLATLLALAAERRAGAELGTLAARFHQTLVEVTVALVTEAAADTGLDLVCLSGGVWQNRRLVTAVLDALRGQGLTPLLNESVPVNDGGISYGQAAVAAARLSKE